MSSPADRELWIAVNGWDKFQHYGNRRPVWIKTYVALLDDDNYRDLTPHQRAVLHGLWLTYASSGCQLRLNTASLSSRLNLRVTTEQIKTLNQAGFLTLTASKPLATGYHDARAEVEVELIPPQTPPPRKPAPTLTCPICHQTQPTWTTWRRIREHITNKHELWDGTTQTEADQLVTQASNGTWTAESRPEP